MRHRFCFMVICSSCETSLPGEDWRYILIGLYLDSISISLVLNIYTLTSLFKGHSCACSRDNEDKEFQCQWNCFCLSDDNSLTTGWQWPSLFSATFVRVKRHIVLLLSHEVRYSSTNLRHNHYKPAHRKRNIFFNFQNITLFSTLQKIDPQRTRAASR